METFEYKKIMGIVGIVLGISLSFLSLVFAFNEWKSGGNTNNPQATITVTGEGEAIAKPDVATITFTVRENAKTVPEAQKLTETKIAKGLDSIKSLGVADSDVKTISYSVNPKYVQVAQIPCMYYPCPVQNTKIDGYEVSETISVKIRRIDQAGDALGLIGKANITEINGPSFTIDDTKKLESEAKTKAIAEAKLKAQKIAGDLGVTLGDISSYSENNNGYYPMAYGMGASTKLDAVTVPTGDTNIKMNVSITYIIK